MWFYNGQDIYIQKLKKDDIYKLEYFKQGYYKDISISFSEYASLCCPQIEISCTECETCQKNKDNSGMLLLRLRGETDFNFNDKKCERYEKIINKIKDEETKSNALSLLKECKKMHHSLLNFSLMQSVGKMQEVKSKGLKIRYYYEQLDRLDTFIYYLDDYKKDESLILNCAYANKKCLKDYLDKFKDVYDYCEKIYFIKIEKNKRNTEEDLIQKLIKSGRKALDSCERVIEYMNLAIEFWGKKKEYFESQDQAETDK